MEIKEKIHRKTLQWNGTYCRYKFDNRIPLHLPVSHKMIWQENTKCKPFAVLNQQCYRPKRTKTKKEDKRLTKITEKLIQFPHPTIWNGNIIRREILNLRRGWSWTCKEASSSLRWGCQLWSIFSPVHQLWSC